jgi:hypothetical protein
MIVAGVGPVVELTWTEQRDGKSTKDAFRQEVGAVSPTVCTQSCTSVVSLWMPVRASFMLGLAGDVRELHFGFDHTLVDVDLTSVVRHTARQLSLIQYAVHD